jgi:transposase-like protein
MFWRGREDDIIKHCDSDKSVKNGEVKGKQHFLCKGRRKTFREGDKRIKYTIQQHIRVVKFYTAGVGLRSIERLENIPPLCLCTGLGVLARC